MAYYLGSRCEAVRIANIPAGVGASVKIAGGRDDLKMGTAQTLAIGTNATSATTRSKKKQKKLSTRRTCS